MNKFLLVSVNNQRFGIDMNAVVAIESGETMNQVAGSVIAGEEAIFDLSLFLFNKRNRNYETGKMVMLKTGTGTFRLYVESIEGAVRVPEDLIDTMPPVFGEAVACFPNLIRINEKPVPVLNPDWVKRHYIAEEPEVVWIDDLLCEKAADSVCQEAGPESQPAEISGQEAGSEPQLVYTPGQENGLESRLADTISIDDVTRVIERIVNKKVGDRLTDLYQQVSSAEMAEHS